MAATNDYHLPVMTMLYTKYAKNCTLSATLPDTIVAAVAANTNWKNHPGYKLRGIP